MSFRAGTIYPKTEKTWIHGGTLCYTKKLWHRNPFKHINKGEDKLFLWNNYSTKISPHNKNNYYLGIIHLNNAYPKDNSDSRWVKVIDNILIQKIKKVYGTNKN